MLNRRRLVLAAGWVAMATGCGGNGCDCMQPIPGGFPAEERVPNEVQVRVSSTGLAAIEADPAALIGGLVGGEMGLTFDVPPSCGEGDNPAICCEPVDGPVVEPCGPVAVDVTSLDIVPIQGASSVDVEVLAKVHTVTDLVIWYDIIFTINCGVELDTDAGANDALQILTTIDLVVDAATNTTRIEVGDVIINQLDDEDITLNGGFSCDFANALIGFFKDQLTSGISDVLKEQIEGAVCKECPGGDVSECGELADACSGGTCMRGGACLQEIGLSGRMPASALLGGGGNGALDLYLVAGEYADSNNNGLSLGLLGGMMPGNPAARCGPPSQKPPDVAIARSDFFRGNTRPDTGGAFDLALGVHQNELDLAAWASYEGGFLCQTVGTSTIDLLNSDTLAILMPSLTDLTHGTTAPLFLGLRPQQPPVLQLGPGTFTEGGDIDEPLIDVTLNDLDIDFFALIDDQYVRVMTMNTDLNLPVNLDVTPDGELLPVIGAVDDAFTNITVKNSRALLETPQELADRLPAVLSVALPFLSDAFGPIALPEIGGLTLNVQPDGITSIESNAFLAIFADLAVGGSSAAPAPRIETTAELVTVHMPDREAFFQPTLDPDQRPVIEIALGGLRADGAHASSLEWQYRLDSGPWTPYKRDPRLYLSRNELWLVGEHTVEVRARQIGRPLTADRTPVALRAVVDYTPSLVPELVAQAGPGGAVGFHGRAADSGCNCHIGAATGRGSLLGAGLLLAALVLLRRRRALPSRRAVKRGLSVLLVLAAGALAPAGCSCSSDTGGDDCGDEGCAEGEVEPGPTGRYSDIAADGNRVVVSGYDETLGDLVLLEVAGDGTLTPTVVDGIPADTLSTFDPKTYRRGIVEPGPNVGQWTSVALRDGRAYIAYHDVDAGALKLAAEDGDGKWTSHVVDSGDGVTGWYTSLAFNSGGSPSIAYMATHIDDGASGRKSQLRIAQAGTGSPSATSDWTVTVLDEAGIPCTGLCDSGSACVADTLLCAPIESGCAEDCGSGNACIAGACAAILEPIATDMAEGTGLFANLAFVSGGPVVVYYDRSVGDLVMQENNGGWTRVEIDASADTDRGMFASIDADDSGMVHIAYQDSLADQLLYTTWQAGTLGPVEIVDDGVREGDRPHPVGAGAALVLDAQGLPAVVYQDGAAISARFARRDGGGVWTSGDLMSGEPLYGFFNATVLDGSAVRVSSYLYDRLVYPPGEIAVTSLP